MRKDALSLLDPQVTAQSEVVETRLPGRTLPKLVMFGMSGAHAVAFSVVALGTDAEMTVPEEAPEAAATHAHVNAHTSARSVSIREGRAGGC